MSKRLLFIDMWIPVSAERLPPDDHEEVLLYNSNVGMIFTYPGYMARAMFDKLKCDKTATEIKNGFAFQACDITHWMPVFSPAGQKASCEHYWKETPKWKRRVSGRMS